MHACSSFGEAPPVSWSRWETETPTFLSHNLNLIGISLCLHLLQPVITLALEKPSRVFQQIQALKWGAISLEIVTLVTETAVPIYLMMRMATIGVNNLQEQLARAETRNAHALSAASSWPSI